MICGYRKTAQSSSANAVSEMGFIWQVRIDIEYDPDDLPCSNAIQQIEPCHQSSNHISMPFFVSSPP